MNQPHVKFAREYFDAHKNEFGFYMPSVFHRAINII